MKVFRRLMHEFLGQSLSSSAGDILKAYEDGLPMDAENSVTINFYTADCSPYDSKLGGVPYMLKDFSWPMDLRQGRENKPLAFLGQINFSQMPPLKGYPRYGILQFYIGTDVSYGLDLAEPTRQSGFRIVFHANVDCNEKMLNNQIPNIHFEGISPIARELKMGFSPAISVISWSDFRYESYLLDAYKQEFPLVQSIDEIPEELRNKLEELCEGSGSRIGGYPMFTQEDPRHDGAESASYTDLLFQLDSQSSEFIHLGDEGVLHFFIKPKNLQELNFSDVWYNWDCY